MYLRVPLTVLFVSSLAATTSFSSVLAGKIAGPLEAFSEKAFSSISRKGPELPPDSEGKDGPVHVWVQFVDKGFQDEETFAAKAAEERGSTLERTLRRRAKGLSPGEPIQPEDLPVYEPYVSAVLRLGAIERTRSRWFNAVSVECLRNVTEKIARLSFVYRICPVAQWQRRPKQPDDAPEQPDPISKGDESDLDYGSSADQIEQISAHHLHEMGLTGRGVVIGILDEGFAPWSVRSLRSTSILSMKDFVDGDGTPFESPSHGTSVLSVMAANDPGSLVGVAYGADYLLARTEVQQFEQPVEEDFWVAGLEWLEREGADVVNSSLGYDGWYGAPDYDGQTATTTVAAEYAAVEKGLFIVNSAGNEAGQRIPDPEYPDYKGSLVVPADGPNVCAVGGVDSNGLIVTSSSRGPTFDGRIKPDLCARGRWVYIAQTRFLDKSIYDSNKDSATQVHRIEAAFVPNAPSQTLWIAASLQSRIVGEFVRFGSLADGFSGGLAATLIRNGTPTPLFNREFNDPSVLTDPWPEGFQYSGERIVVTEGGIETDPGNRIDLVLALDLTKALPVGGLLPSDQIEVATSFDPTPGGDLRLSYLTDSDINSIRTGSGTSYAAPMIAGAAALLLEARPDWGPRELLAALRSTASRSENPDNDYGYGIADASAAFSFDPMPEDISLDARIDADDLLLLQDDWLRGTQPGRKAENRGKRSDLNRDGGISWQDVWQLMTRWGISQ
jgi:subtilisin family serine protease